MSKKAKALIWGAALVLLGAAVFAGASAAIHFRYDKLDTQDFDTTVYNIDTAEEPFTRIEVDVSNAYVYFHAVCEKPGVAQIYADEYVDEKHKVEVVDGVLRITDAEERSFWQRIGFRFSSPAIMLFLPENEYEAFTVTDDTGAVHVDDAFRLKKLTVNGSTVDVELAEAQIEEAEITTDTGDVEITDVKAGKLTAKVSTGSVTVKDTAVDGAVTLSATTGDVHMTDMRAEEAVVKLSASTGNVSVTGCAVRSLEIAVTSGTVRLTDTDAAADLVCTADTGDVFLKRFDAGALDITTHTGEISGTLKTPKVFSAHSYTGDVQVPADGVGGPCSLVTSTGDITLTVLE